MKTPGQDCTKLNNQQPGWEHGKGLHIKGQGGWVEYRFAATKLIQQVTILQLGATEKKFGNQYVTKSFVLKVLSPGSRNTWKLLERWPGTGTAKTVYNAQGDGVAADGLRLEMVGKPPKDGWSRLEQIYVTGVDTSHVRGWEVCDATNRDAASIAASKGVVRQGAEDHTIIRHCSVRHGNGGDWEAGSEEQDSCEWWVAPKNYWDHKGFHTLCPPGGQPQVVIKAVLDLGSGTPGAAAKGVELLALTDVQDLSLFSIGIANNGRGSDGMEIKLSKVALAKGDSFWLLRDSVQFAKYFGSTAFNLIKKYVEHPKVSLSGNDAVELFYAGLPVDRFGDPNQDGAGTAWDYQNSWALRKDGTHPSPTFDKKLWTLGPTQCSMVKTLNQNTSALGGPPKQLIHEPGVTCDQHAKDPHWGGDCTQLNNGQPGWGGGKGLHIKSGSGWVEYRFASKKVVQQITVHQLDRGMYSTPEYQLWVLEGFYDRALLHQYHHASSNQTYVVPGNGVVCDGVRVVMTGKAPGGGGWSRMQQVWVRGVDGGPAIATTSATTGNCDCLCRFPTFPCP
jgi:hypothetical protein